METLKKFTGRWGPALAVMAVIYWASDMPGNNLPRFGMWDALVKKGGHALGYALLAVTYLHALAPDRPPAARPAALAVALAAVYAVTDEFHQGFVAVRTPSPVDVLIDAAGAVAGVGLRFALRGWRLRTGRRGH